MTGTVLLCVGAIGLWALNLLRSMAEPLIKAEVAGSLEDRLTARVRKAAELLPTEIAEELEAEWLAELDAVRDRPRLALRFVRGLPTAAAAIAADLQPASIGAGLGRPLLGDVVSDENAPRRRHAEAVTIGWARFVAAAPTQEAEVVRATFSGESIVSIASRLGITASAVSVLRTRGVNRLSALSTIDPAPPPEQ